MLIDSQGHTVGDAGIRLSGTLDPVTGASLFCVKGTLLQLRH